MIRFKGELPNGPDLGTRISQRFTIKGVPETYFVAKDGTLRGNHTFDLHETLVGDATCTCPNHRAEKCDCQIVVLLVYGKESQPVSLVAHGHNGQTWFSLVEFLGGTNARLEAQIRGILSPVETNPPTGEVL